ncbi:helix-turn-helix domain-containing protein [Nocardia abscessus]|uniref:AraC-like ligand-binding domain-containing protein n=1 Tax=Nocardia abscessus TaxID=120957 RepID=UPI0003046D8D|nr:helix-turn-helix domain-containing protein [Nocardia abscessus]MCC3330929.1 helix-turn-helix domain-containing protein [Nocardia abscessus]
MLVTEFSTESLSIEDQLACWLDLMDRDLVPTRMRSTTEEGFAGRARTLTWEGVQISVMSYPSVQVTRTPKLIRQSDPEAYQVNLVLDGEAAIRQAGREAIFGAGEFAVFDTSRPFEGWRSCGLGGRSMTLQISRALLPLPAGGIDRLTAIPFGAHHGIGAAFARWLTDLTTRADEFSPADAPTLTSVTVDLLSAVLAAPIDAEGMLVPESGRRALRLQINGFIEQRLGDPALTPKAIAEAHHISLRSLQQLFAADKTTPATWIRRRRLERCRRDLVNPYLRHRPIHSIAARWGFTDPAHFSRVFRKSFGLPPSDYRHNALLRE